MAQPAEAPDVEEVDLDEHTVAQAAFLIERKKDADSHRSRTKEFKDQIMQHMIDNQLEQFELDGKEFVLDCKKKPVDTWEAFRQYLIERHQTTVAIEDLKDDIKLLKMQMTKLSKAFKYNLRIRIPKNKNNNKAAQSRKRPRLSATAEKENNDDDDDESGDSDEDDDDDEDDDEEENKSQKAQSQIAQHARVQQAQAQQAARLQPLSAPKAVQVEFVDVVKS